MFTALKLAVMVWIVWYVCRVIRALLAAPPEEEPVEPTT